MGTQCKRSIEVLEFLPVLSEAKSPSKNDKRDSSSREPGLRMTTGDIPRAANFAQNDTDFAWVGRRLLEVAALAGLDQFVEILDLALQP